jgi:hypothetical protein
LGAWGAILERGVDEHPGFARALPSVWRVSGAIPERGLDEHPSFARALPSVWGV